MSQLPHGSSFRDLIAYQKARALSREIFALNRSFPKEEMYSLTDQVRRSSRSVGAQIAEAWAKRRYEKHFISKLVDADGEQHETQHWIDTAAYCDYISQEQAKILNEKCKEIGRLVEGMISKASLFCGTSTTYAIRESIADYIIKSSDTGDW